MKRLLLLYLLLTGCDWLDVGKVCTTSVEPALVVHVVDPTTMQPVRGRYPVIARDGAVVDTADIYVPSNVNPDSMYWGPFALAFERPGRCDVEVTAPGYGQWRGPGIRITDGECHETVELVARLQT